MGRGRMRIMSRIGISRVGGKCRGCCGMWTWRCKMGVVWVNGDLRVFLECVYTMVVLWGIFILDTGYRRYWRCDGLG